MYQVMTAIAYYAGLRPSEVVMLRPRALHLPSAGWGSIDVVEADIDYDEPGEPKTDDRSVPIPPCLVELLRAWIAEHGLGNDDLLFRTRNDRRPAPSNWSRGLRRALQTVGHRPLRVYDLRHAAATTWLRAGVPPGEVARRPGHSVETLVSTYVGAGIGQGSTAAVESDSMGLYQLAVASTVSATAAGLVTLMVIGRSRLPVRRRNLVALAIGLTFAFGTSSWSTASRALWQHGPSMALLAGALVVAVRATKHWTTTSFIALGGIAGAAYTVRPTNAIVVVAFGVWCALRGVRPLAAYGIGGALVALPWMLVNRWSFGDVIPLTTLSPGSLCTTSTERLWSPTS